MNEKTLNKTTPLCGDQHLGGYVLLERVDNDRWRAYEWSAFFVRLVLSIGAGTPYLDEDGNAVTELSAYNVMQLGSRLEAGRTDTPDQLIFVIPEALAISDQVFIRWKKGLHAEIKTESHELQDTVHR